MEPRVLRYRAGRRALARLRENGLTPDQVVAVTGPASGPKWLALAGLDWALLESGLALGPPAGGRRLLAGASAGAWRMLALASRAPRRTHQGLVDGYVGQVFERGVTTAEVSDAYRRMLAELFPPAEVEWILDHPAVDVAVHAVRTRRPWPVGSRSAMLTWMPAAAAANLVSPRSVGLFFERVLFHSRTDGFRGDLRGVLAPLGPEGFQAVALSTGSVPLALDPVSDPPGGPPGAYFDGGVADYHLATRYAAPAGGVVLFPHYQKDIAPGWFDKHLWRSPPRTLVEDVLQVYPDPSWAASLPGGRLPDRRDFTIFVDRPDERMRRWYEVVARSEELGAAFADDLLSGRLVDSVEPI